MARGLELFEIRLATGAGSFLIHGAFHTLIGNTSFRQGWETHRDIRVFILFELVTCDFFLRLIRLCIECVSQVARVSSKIVVTAFVAYYAS